MPRLSKTNTPCCLYGFKVKHFVFTFKSDEPGIFQASWSVETHPKLEEPIEPVVLRGISSVRDTKQLPRRLLHADMVGRVKEQEVSVAMERIVRGIATPPRKAGQELTAEQQAKMNLFMAQNMVLDGPVMYYHEETFAGMSELYKEAHLMLHPVLSEEELAALEKAKAKDKNAEEEPDPFESEEWSGSVEQLGAILLAAAMALEAKAEEEDADLEAIAAQKSRVAQMQSRCEELIETTKVRLPIRTPMLPMKNLAAPGGRSLACAQICPALSVPDRSPPAGKTSWRPSCERRPIGWRSQLWTSTQRPAKRPQQGSSRAL